MARYSGVTCPCCKMPFGDDDDVVVCPECGAPHHRHCWQERGACMYKGKHAQAYRWSDGDPQEEFDANSQLGVICPRCGTNAPRDNAFCVICGHPFQKGQQMLDEAEKLIKETEAAGGGEKALFRSALYPDPPGAFGPDIHSDTVIGDDIHAGEIGTFMKYGSAYYMPKFQQLFDGKRKQIWNWPAFFMSWLAPGFWFLYRKMYRVGSVFVALTFALCLIFSKQLTWFYASIFGLVKEYSLGATFQQIVKALSIMIHMEPFWDVMFYFLLNFMLTLLSGLLATSFFRRHVWRRIEVCRERACGRAEYYQYFLREQGGISLSTGMIALALPIALTGLILLYL